MGPGGESGIPIAAAFGGAAAFNTLKAPSVRADAPASIRPLMQLSNQAVPQVQAATTRGLQAGAYVAMTLPGAAAMGAVAVVEGPIVAKQLHTGLKAVATTVSATAARYQQQAKEFIENALENAQLGSDPVDAFAGAGAGKLLGRLGKGAPSRELAEAESKGTTALSKTLGETGGGATSEFTERVGQAVKIGSKQVTQILETAIRPGGTDSTASQALRKLQRRQGDSLSMGLFNAFALTDDAAVGAVRQILRESTSSQFGRMKLSGFEGQKGIVFFDSAGRGVLVRASDNMFITFVEGARGLTGIFH